MRLSNNIGPNVSYVAPSGILERTSYIPALDPQQAQPKPPENKEKHQHQQTLISRRGYLIQGMRCTPSANPGTCAMDRGLWVQACTNAQQMGRRCAGARSPSTYDKKFFQLTKKTLRKLGDY